MTHSYSVSDGTTTFSLTSGVTCVVRGYVMAAPDIEAQERSTMDDGGALDLPRYKNVTESIEILLLGTTGANLQTNVRALEQLLESAKRRQRRKTEPPVYLQVQLDSDASTWRSEILKATLELDKDALRVWGNFKIEAVLHITRRYYFEGPRNELSISSNGNSAGTGGKAITNNNTSNWIQIASTQIGGSIPTPLEVAITNTSGSTRSYRNFYLANNAFSAPTSFTAGAGSASGALSLVGSYYTARIAYTLSSTVMGYTQGRTFRLLARLSSIAGADTYITPRIRDNSGTAGEILAEGDEVCISSSGYGTQWYDLGAVPLPPGGYYTSWTGVTLTLDCRCTASGTVSVNLLQLTPLDSYQYIVQRGQTVANSVSVTLDHIENVFYTANGPIFSPRSGPLMAWPNVTQKVYILYDEGTSSTTTHTASVRVYARERRLTV